jgi:hypothetical protein
MSEAQNPPAERERQDLGAGETEMFGLGVPGQQRAALIRPYLDPESAPIHLLPRIRGREDGER